MTTGCDGRDPFDDRRPDLPDGVDPLGVPSDQGGHDAFIVTLAVVVALLALTFTLGWVVYHRLVTG